MTRVWLVLTALSAALGMLLGVLAPQDNRAEAATVNLVVAVHPGPTSSSGAWLTCGWHDGACASTVGNALDWDTLPEGNVFWRSRSYRSDASIPAFVATASVFNDDTQTCFTVRTELYDALALPQGSTQHLHTWSWTPGGQFYFDVLGNNKNTSLQEELLGVTVSADKIGCAYSPGYEHLHQTASGFSKAGPPYPDVGAPFTYYTNLWAVVKAQHKRQWSIVY